MMEGVLFSPFWDTLLYVSTRETNGKRKKEWKKKIFNSKMNQTMTIRQGSTSKEVQVYYHFSPTFHPPSLCLISHIPRTQLSSAHNLEVMLRRPDLKS